MKWHMVDLHAHILPGMDDGAKDWEESDQMLELAISQGILTIIATPHYSRCLDVGKVRGMAELVSQRVQKICPEAHVYAGQEIQYFDSVVEVLNTGAALTLADSRYVLMEFMPNVSYKTMYQGLRKLFQGGYLPVVAHVERYEALRKDENLQELRGMGCLLQMNYKSLQGNIWDHNVRWCRRQIQQERIHVLGTDMHHAIGRTPMVDKSLAWLSHHGTPEYLTEITRGQAMRIIISGQT